MHRLLLGMIATLFLGVSTWAGSFEADFTRPGAGALHDQASGAVPHASVKDPSKHLVSTPIGRACRFDEGFNLTYPVKTVFKPPMTIIITFKPTAQPLGPLAGLFQQFSYARGGLRIAYLRGVNTMSVNWDGRGKEYGIETRSALAVGQWHQFALTLDKRSVMKLYVDGKLDLSQQLKPAFVPSSDPTVSLGKYSGQIGDFTGLIRSVKVTDSLAGGFPKVAGRLARWNAKDAAQPSAEAPGPPLPKVDPQTLFQGALLSVNFDGDLAGTSNGQASKPTNVKPAETDKLGRFTLDSVTGKAFDLNAFHVIRYLTPKGFPPAKGGTLSVWIKPADWFSPRGIKVIEAHGWARRKVIFSVDSRKQGAAPWMLGLNIIGPPGQHQIRWLARIGNEINLFHDERFQQRRWHLLTVTWGPDRIDPKHVDAKLFVDGRKVDEAVGMHLPRRAVGAHVNIGSTNPGIAYAGMIDQFHLLDHPLTAAQIQAYWQAVKPVE